MTVNPVWTNRYSYLRPSYSLDHKIMDAEGDGDPDILVHAPGTVSSSSLVLWVKNDGAGNFSLDSSGSSIIYTADHLTEWFRKELTDFNLDGIMDFYSNGRRPGGRRIALADIYLNDGLGNINVYPTSPFTPTWNANVYFGDLDGDNAAEVIVGGDSRMGYPTTSYYQNDGKGNYSLKTDSTLVNVREGFILGGDITGDGLVDVFNSGIKNSSTPISAFYRNSGNGNLVFDTLNNLGHIAYGNAVFLDIDSDGDLDLFRGGKSSYNQLFLNDGAGSFSSNSQFSLLQARSRGAGLDTGDIDGDGDVDILVCDLSGPAYWYRNDGASTIAYKPNMNVEDDLNAVVLRDFDGNGYPDIFGVSGSGSGSTRKIAYYRNDSGMFNKIDTLPLIGMGYGDIDAVDFDGDGDLDVLTSGLDINDSVRLFWYVNDGHGGFQRKMDNTIEPLYHCTINFADIDADGDQDLLMTGLDVVGVEQTYLYRNNLLSGLSDSRFSLLSDWSTNIKVYLNPASNYLYVQREKKGPALVKICGLNGECFLETPIEAELEEIKMELNSGIYLLVILEGSTRSSFPIIIE